MDPPTFFFLTSCGVDKLYNAKMSLVFFSCSNLESFAFTVQFRQNAVKGRANLQNMYSVYQPCSLSLFLNRISKFEFWMCFYMPLTINIRSISNKLVVYIC